MPVVAAIAVLVWFFVNIDNILQPVIQLIFGRRITGVGFGIAIVLIYVAGVAASNLFGRRILRFGESRQFILLQQISCITHEDTFEIHDQVSQGSVVMQIPGLR